MRGFSIRWLFLGVAAISLVVPVVAILSLRSFDSVLVRQTEGELNAQSAVIAAAYQEAWAHAQGLPVGNPRDRWHQTNSYVPLVSELHDLEARHPPIPDPLPERPGGLSDTEKQIGARLSQMLKNAQVFNLSGARILASDGCALASSREQVGLCFGAIPEVKSALSGRAMAALRERVSDEPLPPLTSLQRRGDIRVFVARPVWNDGKVIGVVFVSRTAESGLEWLFKRRKGIFFGALFILALTTLTTVSFSWAITRPLSQMAKVLRGEHPRLSNLASVRAPREIHALGLALDERAQQLESRNHYIAEFAANVSHELKTPLTSIRGAVELLLEGGEEMDPLQRKIFLSNIDAAAERTERLVTRLLYLARLESPQNEEPTDLVSIENYGQDLKRRYGAAVEIRIESGSPLAQTSEGALDAVTGNLIENALRYRKERPVAVSFRSVTEAAHELLHIRVVDDGPGISAQNQKHLFERFFTTERDRGGTGLGLSIVQATAQRRGGRVEVHSDATGTRVDVWM